MGDSEHGTEESGLPSPLPSIPRTLLGRSQSLFTGSAPNTLRATLREAVGADVSVISHREDNQCHSEARLTLKGLSVCSKAKWMMMKRSILMTNHNNYVAKQNF